MWILIAGGLMITLPALVVAVFMIGKVGMLPAIASFTINMLPFVAAYLLLRKQAKNGDIDLGH